MEYSRDLHLQELESKFEDWIESEPDTLSNDEYRWHHHGLKLLRELIKFKPDDPLLKMNLAMTLRWLGRDEKVRLDNQIRARELLEEALNHKPNDPLIHYHLGWLASKRGDRKSAIHYFEHTVASPNVEFSVQIKAHCNLVKLLVHEGDIRGASECTYRAKTAVADRKSRGLDVPGDCMTMVELAEMDLGGQYETYPYTVLCSDGSTWSLTHEQTMEFLAQQTTTTLMLFLLQTHTELKGPVGLWKAPDGFGLARLCEWMMTARIATKAEVLHDELWPTARKTIVTTYVGRLRNHLVTCLGPTGSDAILSTKYGYRWNPEVPWQIVRDVSEPY